jgi:hypothetical protein
MFGPCGYLGRKGDEMAGPSREDDEYDEATVCLTTCEDSLEACINQIAVERCNDDYRRCLDGCDSSIMDDNPGA